MAYSDSGVCANREAFHNAWQVAYSNIVLLLLRGVLLMFEDNCLIMAWCYYNGVKDLIVAFPDVSNLDEEKYHFGLHK